MSATSSPVTVTGLATNTTYTITLNAIVAGNTVQSASTTATGPPIFMKGAVGDITGTTLINYGTAGNFTLSTSNSNNAYLPVISTTAYPSGKSASSLSLPTVNTAGAVWIMSSTYQGGVFTSPTYSVKLFTGYTFAAWIQYTGPDSHIGWVLTLGPAGIAFAENIGINTDFTYNSTSYKFYTGFSFALSAYANGNTGTTYTPWCFGAVPLMAQNTWNHIAITITGTNTNTVYTLYFNGTPYVLGSTQFYVIPAATGGSGTAPSLLGYPVFGSTASVSTSNPYGSIPMNFKNLVVDNTCYTSTQITSLMNMS